METLDISTLWQLAAINAKQLESHICRLYPLPNLIPPESPKVGRWGMLRHSYLRNHREGIYTGMLMKGTLNAHLEEVDRQANEMGQRLISQLAKQANTTEQLKIENQLEWVRRMNSIRNRMDEIILQELIYI